MLVRQSLSKKLGIGALAICMLGSFGAPQKDMERLSDALAPVLTSSGSAARLYFANRCATSRDASGNESAYVSFPQLTLSSGPTSSTPLDAVRAIFSNQQDALVTDRAGMVRITLGVVQPTLLNTKIARLAFTTNARWNPIWAILTIEGQPEMQSAMRKLNVRLPHWRIIDVILGPTGEKYPHLPPALENVTADQALDAVATTFKQLVIYGECTQPGGQGVMLIDYTPLTECDSAQREFCFVPEAKMGRPTPLELSPDPSPSPNAFRPCRRSI